MQESSWLVALRAEDHEHEHDGRCGEGEDDHAWASLRSSTATNRRAMARAKARPLMACGFAIRTRPTGCRWRFTPAPPPRRTARASHLRYLRAKKGRGSRAPEHSPRCSGDWLHLAGAASALPGAGYPGRLSRSWVSASFSVVPSVSPMFPLQCAPFATLSTRPLNFFCGVLLLGLGQERTGGGPMSVGKTIRRMREEKGWSRTEFARFCEIPRTSVVNYEQDLRNPKREALEKMARVFRCDVAAISPSKVLARLAKASEGPVRPVAAADVGEVPVLGEAQAAGFEPAVEAWDDYLAGFGEDTAKFADVKYGWFALRVDGTSMMPALPPGSLLLVAAGEFAKRGNMVVARIAATGQVVVKYYARKDNVVTLSPINLEGDTIRWHVKEQPGYALWMWPVKRIEVDPSSWLGGRVLEGE